MQYRIEFREKYVYMQMIGNANVNKQIEAIKKLISDDRWVGGGLILSDESNYHIEGVSYEESHTYIDLLSKYKDQLGNVKVATFVGDDKLQYGMNRKWEAYVEDIDWLTHHVFHDIAHAKEWLLSFN